jgi:NAD(P)-dependent dehydrogenase (short-subunit alcohol dehydrogenase family)
MAKHFKNQLEKSEGVIINLGSLRGFIPTGAAYGASKAALHNLTIALAQELSPLVRVNCVAPGITLTPMNESKGKEKLEKIAKNSLLQKNAQSQDIAYSTLFLASKYANCITGQTLLVDNGSTFIIKS